MVTDERLYSFACQVASSLGEAEIYSFTREWEAARVQGKWFMLTTMLRGERLVILKAPPEDVLALQEEYEEITPGYHMNKKHWYTLRAGEKITEEVIEELVIDSYMTVVGSLPEEQRPVGWCVRRGGKDEVDT